uniref:Secreted protein n=1 Tax=Setaria digitata TaxID=48799 RepID=A0A915Q783_9BILA
MYCKLSASLFVILSMTNALYLDGQSPQIIPQPPGGDPKCRGCIININCDGQDCLTPKPFTKETIWTMPSTYVPPTYTTPPVPQTDRPGGCRFCPCYIPQPCQICQPCQ